jgi:hypothetical protein
MIADYQSRKIEKRNNERFLLLGWIYVQAGIVLETFNSEYTVKNQV